VSYLGYPNTTGLSVIDYRLTDALADPDGADAFVVEKLIRLPECFLCYGPSGHAPPIEPPPALRNGYVTFGSFNTLPKINESVIETWAAILRTIPEARLLLKNRALADHGTCERYQRLFAEHGVAAHRLDLVAWTTRSSEHLALYNRVDVALDTFPYNGTTTTCEALWMGVPVVSLEGDRHAGRVGVSLLTQTGLTELIAHTADEYTMIAKTLAADTKRLAKYRQTLRDRVTASLCNAEVFTHRLEAAYREMWQHWCNT